MDNYDYYLITITTLICLIGICGIIANILSLIVATRPEMKSNTNLVLMGEYEGSLSRCNLTNKKC